MGSFIEFMMYMYVGSEKSDTVLFEIPYMTAATSPAAGGIQYI